MLSPLRCPPCSEGGEKINKKKQTKKILGCRFPPRCRPHLCAFIADDARVCARRPGDPTHSPVLLRIRDCGGDSHSHSPPPRLEDTLSLSLSLSPSLSHTPKKEKNRKKVQRDLESYRAEYEGAGVWNKSFAVFFFLPSSFSPDVGEQISVQAAAAAAAGSGFLYGNPGDYNQSPTIAPAESPMGGRSR